MTGATEATARAPRGTARLRLLDAAVEVVRARGYHATTVDDLCAAAGVTKGAFFHHFDSKSDLAVAAADHWSTTTGELFASAPFNDARTPMERNLAYLDFRASLITGPPESFTCLVGTMVQEVFATDPEIRDACAASILGHAATLEADLDAALTDTARAEGITGRSLARHTQVVLQGAFVLAKAADDPTIVIDSIDHLRRYLIGLFQPPVR
ncbi:MAG: TetR/AcrR family transcriptional regulator [Acidimicrobiales bacterium]